MTLLNAPEYDARREDRKRNLLIGSVVVVFVAAIVAVAGFLTGHGWFFSNNDPNWQQHPQKYDYTLQRFTEDWTTASDWGGPIQSFHVDVSKRDHTGVVVAARVVGQKGTKKVFLKYEDADGTLSYFPMTLEY
jgi:hypothetical protein